LASAFLLLVFVVHLPTPFMRFKLDHHKVQDARRYLRLEIGLILVMLGVGVAGFLTYPNILAMTVPYVVLALSYAWVEDNIAYTTISAGKEQIRERLRRIKISADDRKLGEVARDNSLVAGVGSLNRLLNDPKRGYISYLKIATATGLSAILGVLGIYAGLAGASHILGIRASQPKARTKPANALAKTNASHKDGASAKDKSVTSDSQGVATPITPLSIQWPTVCGANATYPGYKAPVWAEETLYNLYLGNGGPGATGAGCTGVTQAPPGLQQSFVYEIGSDPGGELSVATDSKKLGAALFYAPAVSSVLALIAQFGDVGGSGRQNVANGDVQMLYDTEGTEAFIRDEKVLTFDTSDAAPYEELPPAVAIDWYYAMQFQGRWLWPMQGADDPMTGDETFTFSLNSITPSIVESVEYNAGTLLAYRNVEGAEVSNSGMGIMIPSSGITAYAHSAR
jgi:hypothetical protein